MMDATKAATYFAKVNNFLDDLKDSGKERMSPDELKLLVLENFPEFKVQIEKIDFNDPNLVELMLKLVPDEYRDLVKMFLKRLMPPRSAKVKSNTRRKKC